MTSAWRSEAGIESTTACTALRSASPEQGVRHPVDGLLRAVGHEPQLAAVEEQLELAPVERARLRRVVEDRRRAPGRALDPVVLADVARERDDPVGAVLVPAAVVDVV